MLFVSWILVGCSRASLKQKQQFLDLKSSSFNGEASTDTHISCTGQSDRSPELSWSSPPEGTHSFSSRSIRTYHSVLRSRTGCCMTCLPKNGSWRRTFRSKRSFPMVLVRVRTIITGPAMWGHVSAREHIIMYSRLTLWIRSWTWLLEPQRSRY